MIIEGTLTATFLIHLTVDQLLLPRFSKEASELCLETRDFYLKKLNEREESKHLATNFQNQVSRIPCTPALFIKNRVLCTLSVSSNNLQLSNIGKGDLQNNQ